MQRVQRLKAGMYGREFTNVPSGKVMVILKTRPDVRIPTFLKSERNEAREEDCNVR